MASGTTSTTVKYSEPESIKNEKVLIPIGNQCTHISFSLVVLVPDDWLQKLDNLKDEPRPEDVPELEDDDSEEELEPEYG